MELLHAFSTSYGTVKNRELILVEVKDEVGITGWGEVVAFSTPWYTEETIQTCFHILENFLIPSLLGKNIEHPSEVTTLFRSIKRNHMAKAALDCAVWDLYAKREGVPLSTLLGGTRKTIEAGVVIGINELPVMIKTIEKHVQEGYKRFKVKIKPGNDYEVIKGIRQHFPTLPLMADANSGYTLQDIDLLKRLNDFHLMMIEQPLDSDDIIDHAQLQKQLKTPICLDESIVSYEDARKAIELGSCQVINVKIGRVGGLSEAVKIHDLCKKTGIQLWVGGMLESGISRAHNIALASLPHFTIPGDISASSRYWNQDVISPEVTLSDGEILVPTSAGIGYEVNESYVKQLAKQVKIYTL